MEISAYQISNKWNYSFIGMTLGYSIVIGRPVFDRIELTL